MNPLPLLLAELRRSRAGCFAIVALVALSVALGVAVTTQERSLKQGSARAADGFDLLVGAPGSAAQLVLTTIYLQPAALPLIPGEQLSAILGSGRTSLAAPIALGDRFGAYPIIGTTAEFARRGGRIAMAEGDVFKALDEAVIGAAVDLPLGGTLTPMHGMPLGRVKDHAEPHPFDRHEGTSFRVVGRLPSLGTPWDRAILVPIEAVWQVHGLGTGHAPKATHLGPPFEADPPPGVPTIVLTPRSIADAYGLRASLRNKGLLAVFPAEILVDLYATLGQIRGVMTAMALATQALVVAAILLAVVATLAARRRQIAVLRALGAPRRFILLAVWVQVSALVFAGGLLGLPLGWAAASGISLWLGSVTGVALPVALGWSEVILVAGMAALGGGLALLPALLAYRRPVAADLRL